MMPRQGRTVFSYPGVMQHAQQAALALHEVSELEVFATAFVFREQGPLARVLRSGCVPGGARLLRQLQRRTITELPDEKVHSYPFWELVRSAADRAGASAITVDRIWDRMAQSFDRAVARNQVPGARAIHAFEYTALESFRAAQREGVKRVLHLPSLDSKAFELLRQRELDQWPTIARDDEAYFQGRFNARYERRVQETSLAEVIVVNSSLTGRSHAAAGVDPAKIAVVSLGAPPVPASALARVFDAGRPLSVLWAGSFQLRKGAHYFLQAWRALAPGPHAQARVYGSIELPALLLANIPNSIEFRPTIPQAELWSEFERSDVLVFPTLSDGFGMVVSEALSRGLPIITTDQAGACDLIEHGKNGLVIPAADPAALQGALQWCLDNRAALEHMRSAALATAMANQWSTYRKRLRKALGIVGAQTDTQ